MRFSPVCVLLFMGLTIQSFTANAQEAQEPQGQSENAKEPGQSDNSEQSVFMRAPASVTGSNPDLLASRQESRNAISAGLRVTGLFSDNLLNAFNAGRRQSDYQYSVAPGVGLNLFRPHTQFRLSYDGGVTFDQRFQERSAVTHNFEGYLQHDLTQRLALELREGYLDSSDPFARFGQSQPLPSSFGPGQINSLVVPTFANQIVNTSSGSLSYQLSHYSSVGLSGNFFSQRFRHVANTTSGALIDSKAGAGRVFFAHQITRDQEVGVEYQLQELTFVGGQSRVVTQSVFLFDEIAISPSMRLSLFAGPQHSHVRDLVTFSSNLSLRGFPITSNDWYPAAGLTYTWRGKHTGLQVSALRTISNGGGLQGASLSNSANLGIRRSFTRLWSAGLGLGYVDGHAIGVLNRNVNNRIRVEQAYVAVERTITNSLTAQVRYLFWRQPRITSLNQSTSPSHTNQIEVGLTYRFTRPL